MTKVRRIVVVVASSALVLAAAGCGDDQADDQAADGGGSTTTEAEPTSDGDLSGTVTVMAPGPFTALIEAAMAEFEAAHPGVDVEVNFGHVPALLAQIEGGVAADVLITPDAGSMDQASGKDMVDGAPVVIARSPLALVVPAGNAAGVDGVDALADDELRVAVCAAELPCGKLAEELAAANELTLSADSLEPGGSPGIVTKASTGEIDLGVVFAADVAAGGDKVERIDIPESSNVSSAVSAAVLSASDDAEAASAFVAFLASAAGTELVVDAGFAEP